MTDPNNGVTTNHYDPSTHQITSQDDPMSPTRTTTFSYSGGITTITDPKGNVTHEEYLNGISLSRTVGYGTAQAATSTFAFDPAVVGLTASVGPNGETVTTTRDASANVLSETDGLGRTTTYTYNSFSEPLTILDATSVTTTNVYNTTGDLTSSSRPLVGGGQTQTATYNRTDAVHPGDVTSMVDPDSKTWTYTYDANGYRNSVTDPLNNLASYVYNSKSWMTSSVAPNGNTSRQDTFVRTPVSGSWGTATDGNVWTKQVGSATYSTTGTQGKIASPSSDSFDSLGPALANDGGEVLVRWQVAATTNKAGAVLRMSAAAATYYGVRFDGAPSGCSASGRHHPHTSYRQRPRQLHPRHGLAVVQIPDRRQHPLLQVWAMAPLSPPAGVARPPTPASMGPAPCRPLRQRQQCDRRQVRPVLRQSLRHHDLHLQQLRPSDRDDRPREPHHDLALRRQPEPGQGHRRQQQPDHQRLRRRQRADPGQARRLAADHPDHRLQRRRHGARPEGRQGHRHPELPLRQPGSPPPSHRPGSNVTTYVYDPTATCSPSRTRAVTCGSVATSCTTCVTLATS
jgi:YD repeat-containing protein